MPKATWQGNVIAESERTEIVEGNHYFPPGDVNDELLEPSDTTPTCPWKGEDSYYHVVVDGEKNEDAAWVYPSPKPEAAQIEDHLAFWNGVQVED